MNDSTDKEIEIFNLTAEKLYSFTERLIKEIKNYKFSYNDKNQCYLILDTWLHDLLNNIEEYERNYYYLYNKTNPDGSFIFWPYDDPIFINNIPLAIDYLKKYQYLEVINRELLELIYEDKYLGNENTESKIDEIKKDCDDLCNKLFDIFKQMTNGGATPYGIKGKKEDVINITNIPAIQIEDLGNFVSDNTDKIKSRLLYTP